MFCFVCLHVGSGRAAAASWRLARSVCIYIYIAAVPEQVKAQTPEAGTWSCQKQ